MCILLAGNLQPTVLTIHSKLPPVPESERRSMVKELEKISERLVEVFVEISQHPACQCL